MEGPIRQSELPSTAALAYLGDAVHSLYMRERAVEEGFARSERLHRYTAGAVNAAAQARMLEAILPHLTEAERDVCRRAGNYRHLHAPKHMSAADYRRATGFEAVLGMLYWLGERERLRELLRLAYTALKEDENQ